VIQLQIFPWQNNSFVLFLFHSFATQHPLIQNYKIIWQRINLFPSQKYILVEKRKCALLKNQLKINIKIKFINCVQYIIAILFIFPLMFKTDIFHIMWAHDMIPIIANR
jgi:hypothetical protein